MVYFILSLSVTVNLVVPTPDAIVIPDTSITPLLGTGCMFMNRVSFEQMWRVAQMVAPDSVG